MADPPREVAKLPEGDPELLEVIRGVGKVIREHGPGREDHVCSLIVGVMQADGTVSWAFNCADPRDLAMFALLLPDFTRRQLAEYLDLSDGTEESPDG